MSPEKCGCRSNSVASEFGEAPEDVKYKLPFGNSYP